MFCEVCHFYGMNYREVMDLPIQAFWLMWSNVRRIRAGEDMRLMMVGAAVQSADGIQECQERLVLEMGDVFVNHDHNPLEAKRDEAGFAELKQLALAI